MTKNIYVNQELSAELEALGVNQPTGLGVAYAMVNKEMAPNGERYVPYTIFDLLYPENAEKVWGKKWNSQDSFAGQDGTATEALLMLWQRGRDWQAFVADSVELRKLDGKVVEELVK